MDWPISWNDVKEGLEQANAGIPFFDLVEIGLEPINIGVRANCANNCLELFHALMEGPVRIRYSVVGVGTIESTVDGISSVIVDGEPIGYSTTIITQNNTALGGVTFGGSVDGQLWAEMLVIETLDI